MRTALTILTLCLLLASSACCQTMKTPAGCIPDQGATLGYGGYANRVVHQRTGIVLILITPGAFQMGASASQAAYSNVYPYHQVTISYPFYIGKTEVTNGQFRPFTTTGYDGARDVDPAYDLYIRHIRGLSIMPTGDNYPITYVSWKNAKAFCGWAGELDLPSESEWEYACRAGTSTTFYFGDTATSIDSYAWTTRNAAGEPHPVGQKQPNAWGLYDVCGNVWEWTLDDFIYRYDNAPSDGTPRVEGKWTKALRGGAWGNGGVTYTAASYSRFNSAPGNASNDVGFRVVIRIDPTWTGHKYIPYQGKLSNNGQPMNGTASIKFDIFDVESGGTAVWSGTAGNVTVTKGVFSKRIGPVLPSLFQENRDLWLQITVNGQVMIPRTKLQLAPYAGRSFTDAL